MVSSVSAENRLWLGKRTFGWRVCNGWSAERRFRSGPNLEQPPIRWSTQAKGGRSRSQTGGHDDDPVRVLHDSTSIASVVQDPPLLFWTSREERTEPRKDNLATVGMASKDQREVTMKSMNQVGGVRQNERNPT